MFKTSRTALTVSVMTVLASCGGQGGGSAVNSGALTPSGPGVSSPFPRPANQSISSIFGAAGSGAISVGQIDTASAHLSTLLTASSENRVAIERPSDANVTMNGLIGVGDEVKMTVGRLSLNANFTTNQLTGSTADFSNFTGGGVGTTTKLEDLSGRLSITNGAITGSNLAADLTGVLSGSQDVAFDAQLSGSFLSVDGQPHAIGTFGGTTATGAAAPENFTNGTFLVSE